MDILQEFEQQKAGTIQYSLDKLLKVCISDYVLEDCYAIDDSFRNSILSCRAFDSKDKIKTLKSFLRDNRERFHDNMILFQDCLAEIKEIEDDYKWMNSKDGQLIMQIEKWIEVQRKNLSKKNENNHIYIGRSLLEPQSLIIGGIVYNAATAEELKNYFREMNPPIAPSYKFIIDGISKTNMNFSKQ